MSAQATDTRKALTTLLTQGTIDVDQFVAALTALEGNPITDEEVGVQLSAPSRPRGRQPGVMLDKTVYAMMDKLNLDPKGRVVCLTFDEYQDLTGQILDGIADKADKADKVEEPIATISTVAPAQITSNNPLATSAKGKTIQKTNKGLSFGSKSNRSGPMSSGQSVTLKRKCHLDFRLFNGPALPTYQGIERSVGRAMEGGNNAEAVRIQLLAKFPETDCRRETDAKTPAPIPVEQDRIGALESKLDSLIDALGGSK